MKITDHISDLVLELGELESYELASIVIDYDGVSIKGLLEAYTKANNSRSKEVMIEILNEAGYGWLADKDHHWAEIAGPKSAIPFGHTVVASDSDQQSALPVSEFIDLTPVNSYLH